jgi:hypothetical protein
MTTIRIRKARKATLEALTPALQKKANGADGIDPVEVLIYGKVAAVVRINPSTPPALVWAEGDYAAHKATILSAATAAHSLSAATAGIWGNGQGNA